MNFTFEDLNIVFEDNHLLVVVKPQNIPSQADSSEDVDMLTLLKEYLRNKYSKQGNIYLALIHRLDRPTGGVMVFAKTSKAAERLSASMRAGEIEKKYLAVVNGRLPNRNGRLDNYLYKYANLNIVKVVPPTTSGAKRAVLDYKVLAERDGEDSLVQIRLYTGRSHQIRVQMSFIGNSLLGDSKYGTLKGRNPMPLALWAYELRFPHPITKDSMVFRVYPDLSQEPWSRYDLDSILRITMND